VREPKAAPPPSHVTCGLRSLRNQGISGSGVRPVLYTVTCKELWNDFRNATKETPNAAKQNVMKSQRKQSQLQRKRPDDLLSKLEDIRKSIERMADAIQDEVPGVLLEVRRGRPVLLSGSVTDKWSAESFMKAVDLIGDHGGLKYTPKDIREIEIWQEAMVKAAAFLERRLRSVRRIRVEGAACGAWTPTAASTQPSPLASWAAWVHRWFSQKAESSWPAQSRKSKARMSPASAACWGTNSQAQPQLQNNNLYAGIMFYGLAVTNCWVESSTSLTTTALWTPVTNFTFPASPTLIFDANPVGPNGSRFYRAVELPQWRKNLQGGGFSHATWKGWMQSPNKEAKRWNTAVLRNLASTGSGIAMLTRFPQQRFQKSKRRLGLSLLTSATLFARYNRLGATFNPN